MRKAAMASTLVLGLVGSAITHADLRGMDVTVGASPAFMNYRSLEPEGDTDRDAMVYPLTLTTTTNINRITRLHSDLRRLDVSLPAPNGGVGATVEGYQLTVGYQRLFRWSRNFQPWFGVGAVIGQIEAVDRFRTDSDGFLDQMLDDRTSNILSIVVTGSLEWDITRKWIFSTEARYEQPVSDGLQGYGIAAGLRYRF